MAHQKPIVTTIAAGIRLQGDGGQSSGALILTHKPSIDVECDVILCYSETSPHPFITWTYHHDSGRCYRGHYYKTHEEAVEDYKNRRL